MAIAVREMCKDEHVLHPCGHSVLCKWQQKQGGGRKSQVSLRVVTNLHLPLVVSMCGDVFAFAANFIVACAPFVVQFHGTCQDAQGLFLLLRSLVIVESCSSLLR